ncbi:MAG: hypothetical protein II811_02010 [Spirochaetaceae bacterium]|nr:hypothetical protein [Spirochaetaceae bacterium]
MVIVQGIVKGDTVMIQDEKLKVFDGQKITLNVTVDEQKKNAAARFFEVANRMHGNSAGQKWTREELYDR